MKYPIFLFFIILILSLIGNADPTSDLNNSMQQLLKTRNLMGVTVQISQQSKIIYKGNFGSKDNKNPIQNSTMFRVASLSKSFSSVALMQLVEKKLLRLNQTLTQLLGFPVKNPFFPNINITLEMALSHQSSLVQCEPYYSNFLTTTYSAKTGKDVPALKQILMPGGKFYNQCLFSKISAPGEHFQYVNLNFGIAGTIVEKITGVRFDTYQHENILQHLSIGQPQNATFNPATIKNVNNLGIIFEGNSGKWVQNYDYYPDGKLPQRDLTGYVIGTNGVIYGPQGSLRASNSHLSNYIYMLSKKGVTKQGKRIISQESVKEIFKPRFQYHGNISGIAKDFHNYGLGVYRTSYRLNDQIISHEVVQGHSGAAYGLLSGYYYWGKYTMTYIINGALNGYQYGTGTIYQGQRLAIHKGVQKFVKDFQNQSQFESQNIMKNIQEFYNLDTQ